MKSVLNRYHITRMRTASRGHLVVILYDIIIKVLDRANKDFIQQNLVDADKNIHKAQNIFSELLAYLNIEEGGEVSTNLCRLYKHFKSQLRDVNHTDDKEKIKHMIEQTKELRSAWHETEKAARRINHMNMKSGSLLNFMLWKDNPA